jgi:hypothetical protein
MDAWGWIVVYAIGLTVLQLLVYRYLLSDREDVRYEPAFGESDETATPDSSTRATRRARDPVGPPRRPTDARGRGGRPPDARLCPHCGAENEPDRTFDRCWNCAERLA